MNPNLPRPHELRVAVVFGPHGKVRPVWFDLDRKRHDVRSVTNSWHDRRGEIRLLHFHVTTSGALYELVFDQNAASWQLLHIGSL